MDQFRKIDLEGAQAFGGGRVSKTYFSWDGAWVIKLYPPSYDVNAIIDEQRLPHSIKALGIPTPESGDLVCTEDGWRGLLTERINPKKSISRAIADEPDRCEELSRRYARFCKQLHATPCDTQVFESHAQRMRDDVVRCPYIDDDTRSRALARIEATPEATTCIHGDLHIGNVIISGDRTLFIDVGEFSYGNPLYDLGMFYILSSLIPDAAVDGQYHMTRALAMQSWRWFAAEYAGAETDDQIAEFKHEIAPYIGLRFIGVSLAMGRLPDSDAAQAYLDSM